jgi:uncharacterized membrane protein
MIVIISLKMLLVCVSSTELRINIYTECPKKMYTHYDTEY